MNWIIVNKTNDDLYWSNKDGWTEEDYDTFSDAEKENVNLPIDGEWYTIDWKKEGEDD